MASYIVATLYINITITGQLPKINCQLPYIFCKVDLYITVTLPFAKGDHCVQIWLYSVEPPLSNHPKYEDLVLAYNEKN